MSVDLQATCYDPAVDTVVFDIGYVLSEIQLDPVLCGPCKVELLGLARRAFERRLDREPDLVSAPSSPSHSEILTISPDGDGVLAFTTTLTAECDRFPSAALPKEFLDPTWRMRLVEATVAALADDSEAGGGGGGAWNLDQCKLWHGLAGLYTPLDAAQGRSIARFVRSHKMLLDALAASAAAPAGLPGDGGGDGDGEDDDLPTACQGWCFPPLPAGYPFGGDEAAQARAAVESALWRVHPKMAEWVRTGLEARRRSDDPPADDEEDDISILEALEHTPSFYALVRESRDKNDLVLTVESFARNMIDEWTEGVDNAAVFPVPVPVPVLASVPRGSDQAESESDSESQSLPARMAVLEERYTIVFSRDHHDDSTPFGKPGTVEGVRRRLRFLANLLVRFVKKGWVGQGLSEPIDG